MPVAAYKAFSEARALLPKVLPSSFLSTFYATTALYASFIMDTHIGFPSLESPGIKSRDRDDVEDAEPKISRADRRRMKQRRRRQNWRRDNRAGNQGAQPEATLSSTTTRSDLEDKALKIYHDENNSEPAQKRSVPGLTPNSATR